MMARIGVIMKLAKILTKKPKTPKSVLIPVSEKAEVSAFNK